LESQYGGSFAVDTNGVARETNDPNVRFTIKEVTIWDELVARTAELDPGVARGDVHTPSLFWDGRRDIYWHANAEEDTISTEFKTTVDVYIEDCLASAAANSSTPSPSSPETGTNPTTAPPISPGDNDDEEEDGCSLNHTDPTTEDIADTANETLVVDESNVCFVFFFSRGCPHCAKVKEYINGHLRNANVTFQYKAYDVYKSDYSRRLIAGYNYFGWKGSQVVPTIFIGDEDDMTILVGEGSIFDHLLPRIQDLQSQPTACYDFATLLEENPDLADSNLHWGVLTAAALVDSINPCAIAVLLILLGGLIQSVVPATPATEQVHPEQPASTTQSSSQVPEGDQPDDSEDKMVRQTTMTDEEQVQAHEIATESPGEDVEMAASTVVPKTKMSLM
jgi:glutaredoxin